MISEIPKIFLKTHLAPTSTSNTMNMGSTKINAPTQTTTPRYTKRPATSSGTDTHISKFTIESTSTTTTDQGKKSLIRCVQMFHVEYKFTLKFMYFIMHLVLISCFKIEIYQVNARDQIVLN